MSDIVKILRGKRGANWEEQQQAADEIVRLRSENALLLAENDRWGEMVRDEMEQTLKIVAALDIAVPDDLPPETTLMQEVLRRIATLKARVAELQTPHADPERGEREAFTRKPNATTTEAVDA